MAEEDLVVEDDVVLGHLLAQVGDEGVAHPLGLGQGLGVGAELVHLVGLHRQCPLPVDRSGAGEEDGVEAKHDAKLYSTPEDGLLAVQHLGLGEKGRYLVAATFGNVHGVYKPGNVKLRPVVLKEIQDVVGAKYGKDEPFDFVFHGGSGSLPSEISESLGYGVVKMNVDTDTQYAFTRPVVGHMMTEYDGVLKIDGEVGNKKMYDPRAWGKKGEAGMAARVVEACTDLRSVGTKMK